MSLVNTIRQAFRHAARERVFFPVAGWALDRALRWFRTQDGWEDIISASAHVMIDSSSAADARIALGEVMEMVGTYLSPEALEMLRLFDDIVQKHSPKAN